MATVAVAEQAKPLDGPSVTLTIRLIMQGKVRPTILFNYNSPLIHYEISSFTPSITS